MAEYFAYGNYHVNHNGETTANTMLNTHRFTKNEIRVAENQLNPQDPYTNSKVMLATNIFIYSNGAIVGMIQNFNVSEQRQINKLQAIGWEGVVQAVPSNTRGGSLSVTRIALYDSTMFSALGLTTYGLPHNTLGSKIHNKDQHTQKDKWDVYGSEQSTEGKTISSGLVFRTLKDQRAPLEIMVKTRMRGNQEKYYTTTYIDAWIANYSRPISTGNITIAETCTINYGDVY